MTEDKITWESEASVPNRGRGTTFSFFLQQSHCSEVVVLLLFSYFCGCIAIFTAASKWKIGHISSTKGTHPGKSAAVLQSGKSTQFSHMSMSNFDYFFQVPKIINSETEARLVYTNWKYDSCVMTHKCKMGNSVTLVQAKLNSAFMYSTNKQLTELHQTYLSCRSWDDADLSWWC